LLVHGFRPAPPIQPRSTIHLPLSAPLNQVFASFRKGHRADIRRAERNGVTVRYGESSDIDTFYAILQETGERAHFGIHTLEYYRQAWSLFRTNSQLLLSIHNGRATAAHMVFSDGKTGFYLYSGATEQGLQAGANHLLQWHAIQWAHERGCTTYDFWGIPDALGRAATASDSNEHAALEAAAQNDPLVGVYRFKKGFGGHIVRYLPAYDQVYIPPLYALWQRRLQ
jgi:lipid II:glycine glycyltransferase (peptidoglycan interpeptide bridge formation enzyme)